MIQLCINHACSRLAAWLVGLFFFLFSSNIYADRWSPWVEEAFPLFSSVVDLRHIDRESEPQNITTRGLVLNLGGSQWACFDTELLRISAIWSGSGVTHEALAPLSYQRGRPKTPGGQSKLPIPAGSVWMYQGMYPGWQIGQEVITTDPRPSQPSVEEPGRGPLDPEFGRFDAVRFSGNEAIIEYTVSGGSVEERLAATVVDGMVSVCRQFRLAPCARPRWLILGLIADEEEDGVAVSLNNNFAASIQLTQTGKLWTVRVPASEESLGFVVELSNGVSARDVQLQPIPRRPQPANRRWPQHIATAVSQSDRHVAYVVDEIELPLNNPWRRNVRLADLQFFADGTAAAVTLDGDVWMVRGLNGREGPVVWQRFSSGLHEPMGLAIREEEIYVFDRNGVWRLVDLNDDGEADRHELFCNTFTQSAESREFPNAIKLAPDGSLVIAKGGQQASTISRLNGSVIRIAADGRSHTVLGVGFRQPFIGVHPQSGLVTASDQEGQYIPSTPIHIVKYGAFYGFLSHLLPREAYPAPIAKPLTWIPHSVNPSATTQVWLMGANLGPLNQSLIHLGFNRPELFSVIFNHRGGLPQAAVVSIVRDFDVPALNAAVNPIDGCLYIAGFQISGWGTTARRESGLVRLRYTGRPSPFPIGFSATEEGILVQFDQTLDPESALNLANYSIESWNYRRTHKYGSPHYKSDGSIGQDWIFPSSVYLSNDEKAVFIGVADLKPAMQMRIGWSIQSLEGLELSGNLYFTPYDLTPFEPVSEGFGHLKVDLTPRSLSQMPQNPTSISEGKRLYELMGCVACHDTGLVDQPKVGPSWAGLFGKERDLTTPNTTVVADEDYIRESITDPSAKIVRGYDPRETGMPVYAGVLTNRQIDSLVLFIKSLEVTSLQE